MLIDADALGPNTQFRADVAIVGAGPAGIVLALELADAGVEVLLLESGGERPDAASQAHCAGELADGSRHPPPDTYRRRGLGGASTIWGGRCVPLDPVDFAPRPWLNLPSTWPITYDSMLPYWRRAQAWAELGRFDYAAGTAVAGGMRPMFAGFVASAISTERIERFSRPTNFAAAYRPRLHRHAKIRVVVHATCTNIALRPNLRAVDHLDLATRRGTSFRAGATAIVLATGGLEVPRLLLASNGDLPRGIGNRHDLVGRYYMSHLAGTLGRFTSGAAPPPWHGYEQSATGVYCRRRLSVEAWAQQAWRIGNVIGRLHHPPAGDPAHATGALSALYFARGLLPREYGSHLAQGDDRTAMLPHVWNIARDPFGTARFVAHSLRYRFLAARKYPSVTIVPRGGAFTLEMHAEQMPNPDSRITLGQGTDRFGMPMLRIDWRHSATDIRTVRVAMALFAEAVAAGRHGRLSFDASAVEADILRDGAYGGHHLGATRMSDSPHTGVVDAQCRVHGTDNLFVASGAVFPTSGQANPTLTILALALRLGDHLRQLLQRPGAATAAPASAAARQSVTTPA
jgi:choline dehydrogenase-like flavoprotein